MQEAIKKRCLEYAGHISAVSGTAVAVLDTAERQFLPITDTQLATAAATGAGDLPSPAEPQAALPACTACGYERCNACNTHLYGSNEAYRWSGKYIYYCPCGLVFAASSISDDTDALTAGLIAGPIIMGNLDDTLEALPEQADPEFVRTLPVRTPEAVNHLASLLSAVASFVSGVPYRHVDIAPYEQADLLNAVYEVRERFQTENAYYNPIEYEKKLHHLIVSRDKNGARALLNELLGCIYFSSHFNLADIKARVTELTVLLSRATIEAGADIQEVFLFNKNHINDIQHFTSIEELSRWLTGVMHRFVGYTFDFVQSKHSDVVYKAMEYVKTYYMKRITLDDVAQHVYLSRSYLSSIFKKETGRSLVAYINQVRIAKSKLFLLDGGIPIADIAGMCGFDDQSYFTKVFKRETGVSPKRYRDTRGDAAAEAPSAGEKKTVGNKEKYKTPAGA